jgi:hypothetical protein
MDPREWWCKNVCGPVVSNVIVQATSQPPAHAGFSLTDFENRVLRRIFGPKRDEVTGGSRKLHNEELTSRFFTIYFYIISEIVSLLHVFRIQMYIGLYFSSIYHPYCLSLEAHSPNFLP